MRRVLVVAGLLACLPMAARADEVFLKGGGKVSGRILSRTETSIRVDVGPGIVTLPLSSVVSIEEKRSSLHEYEERAARLDDSDARGWLALARWSQSQRLGTQATRAYERVLLIDPENEQANQALGRVLLDGRWVPAQEAYRARGLVLFEGSWMTPAERDDILQTRDARFNELLRLDAERRARDAEIRAAEARARAEQAAYSAGTVGIPLWWGSGSAYPAPRPGRPHGPSWRRKVPSAPANRWQPFGVPPGSPIDVRPSYPIGPSGSFPIGPAGSFPIGPSPPSILQPGPFVGRQHR